MDSSENFAKSKDGVSYKEILSHLNVQNFVFGVVLSEIDTLNYKTLLYRSRRKELDLARSTLLHRANDHSDGLEGLPEIFQSQAGATGAAQVASLDAIMAEQSVYIDISRQIETRWNQVVKDKKTIIALRNRDLKDPRVLEEMRMALRPGFLRGRQADLIEAITEVQPLNGRARSIQWMERYAM